MNVQKNYTVYTGFSTTHGVSHPVGSYGTNLLEVRGTTNVPPSVLLMPLTFCPSFIMVEKF
jgi:hypothetical protein